MRVLFEHVLWSAHSWTFALTFVCQNFSIYILRKKQTYLCQTAKLSIEGVQKRLYRIENKNRRKNVEKLFLGLQQLYKMILYTFGPCQAWYELIFSPFMSFSIQFKFARKEYQDLDCLTKFRKSICPILQCNVKITLAARVLLKFCKSDLIKLPTKWSGPPLLGCMVSIWCCIPRVDRYLLRSRSIVLKRCIW